MASRDDYTVGWVCALQVEVAAAKAALDNIHTESTADPTLEGDNSYILGSLDGHNVVLTYPTSGVYGATSVVSVVKQLHASFKHVRFSLVVGIGGGVPSTKEDIRLGDVVVSKPTAGRPGHVQYETGEEYEGGRVLNAKAIDRPSTLLLTAAGKAETAKIFDESRIPTYISEIVRKDPVTFAYPGPEQDILFDSDYDHTSSEPEAQDCNHCDPDRILHRAPRETQNPVVHYGLVASSIGRMDLGAKRDEVAHREEILCFDTETPGLTDTAHCLIIRGVCDYADSHASDLWHAYAAVTATAYAKEVLSLIPTLPKPMSGAANTYAVAAPVLDALLLTRPEVDRASLVTLKGRRVDGTCEWLTQHSDYQSWLDDAGQPLLWVSGGPGKGKTMLAIYTTEVLQSVIHSAEDVLLYYFCSNRDKNRNSAVTIMRGIIHQWLTVQPHLAQHIKSAFEGTETTKYTVSSFVSLWRVFLTLLQQSGSGQVVCVLDGLDECEKESLKQLLDAVVSYLSGTAKESRPRLKLVFFSRPQPAILGNRLGQYQRIKLDESEKEVSNDVKRYIFAKVEELADEQQLSEDMILQVREALLAGAEGTFLWVGFVANELKGRSWSKINDILSSIPKTLGGVYQRLLQQVEDKEKLVPILQWIVLAARPLTVDELTVAAEIEPHGTLSPTDVVKKQLVSCGLMVKVEGTVVNLVHESAKEFFQSGQVNVEGIDMFHMTRHTHRALMRKCLTHVERSYSAPESAGENSHLDVISDYASLYWPEHFQHAGDSIDGKSEFTRPFFRDDSTIRERWWTFYWEQQKNGGDAPSFTLLHLAAYLGNITWAKILLSQHGRPISRKDNYGRMPLSWAVNRGYREMVELLIDNGARVDSKDRSSLTALHIAVTAEHKDIVALLLDRKARIDAKADGGDTPLIRAIRSDSEDIVELLLRYGARVDELPTPPGVTLLKGPSEPSEERAKELMGLQEQLFALRYQQSSRRVRVVMGALNLSHRFPLLMQLVARYLKYLSLSRWESQAVLQELVKYNRTDELRTWAQSYRRFFTQLVVAKDPKRLAAMTDLPTLIFREVSIADLNALLVISVLVGSECKLAAVRSGWRDGDAIAGRAFSHWASVACRRGAKEFLHYGIREFLIDFDDCIRNGSRKENVDRSVFLLTCHYAMIENEDEQPIEYFSHVVAEFYERYIGRSYEDQLFNDAYQACARELVVVSEAHDAHRLCLLLTSIIHFAERARTKGQDRLLNIPSASCLILCQNNAKAHQWLIGEAIPERLSGLISQQRPGPLQKRAYKTLVECLIAGKQHALALPTASRQKVKQNLSLLQENDVILEQILEPSSITRAGTGLRRQSEAMT